MTQPDWQAARAAMMLDPTIIPLNTGSFGASPRRVFAKAAEVRAMLAASPTTFFMRRQPALLWEARSRLAAFLGTDPRRLMFATNISNALNLVAAGLPLSSPGEILLTDHEYQAMVWLWELTARKRKLTFRTFAIPALPEAPGEILEAFERAITPQTRLLFFSHVLSPNGTVLPAKEICALARRKGVLSVVDGAHAPAMLPLNIDAIDADFYAGNNHKWLMAPTNSAFLVMRAGNEELLQPLQISWGWPIERQNRYEPDIFGSTPRIRHLEMEGSRDPSAWLATPEAIDFQSQLGWEAVRARQKELGAYSRQVIGERFALSPATPGNPELHGAMTAFWLPAGLNPETVRHQLWDRHKIEVNIVERPHGALLRLSTHFFNQTWEIDRLAEVLPEVLGSGL